MNLVTFTEEIFNEKLHFLCSVSDATNLGKFSGSIIFIKIPCTYIPYRTCMYCELVKGT